MLFSRQVLIKEVGIVTTIGRQREIDGHTTTEISTDRHRQTNEQIDNKTDTDRRNFELRMTLIIIFT